METLILGAGTTATLGTEFIAAGFTSITGESGADLLTFSAATGSSSTAFSVNGGGGADTIAISGAASNITFVAGGGTAAITGGTGADSITGGTGADSITGGSGADSISASVGVDSITGGAGADAIAIGLTGQKVYYTSAAVTAVETTVGIVTSGSTSLATADVIDVSALSTTGNTLLVNFNAYDATAGATITGTNASNSLVTTGAAVAHTVTWTPGTYSSSTGIFTYSASGTSTLVQDELSASDGAVIDIVLTGVAVASATAASGIVTFVF